ncbi:hypothetical protein [Deefgea rivuli]|uniref:hypothetical protein n=1 Tax=Deefgea rivuli TaxID=400948 RepID=UPI00056D68F3|nr:hypothetical protein [Deefgea rivuli]
MLSYVFLSWVRAMLQMKWLSGVLLLLLLTPAQALEKPDFHLKDRGSVKRQADAVLALMSYSVILDLASSNLTIQNSNSDEKNLVMSQLGGGDVISETTPLYLEGAIAYSRFDPTFVATNGTETRDIPLKWTTITGTGGIGWDFPLSENWVVRPIFDFSLGKVVSDLRAANWWVNQKAQTDFDFFKNGSMNAYGLGGALMFDYELVKPEYEVDVELRFSAMHLETFKSSDIVSGSADSQTANIWTRYRAPTGMTLLQRPVRYVLEASHSHYFGDQAGVLGFDYLSTVGVGLELDSSAYSVIVTRTRLVGRYMFGPGVSGFGVGLAVSF